MNQLFGLQHRRGLTLLCHDLSRSPQRGGGPGGQRGDDLSRPPQRGGGPGGQGWPREA